jgi:hypothetical protein
VYDYALDIGCLFTLAEKDRIKYADALAKFPSSAPFFAAAPGSPEMSP